MKFVKSYANGLQPTTKSECFNNKSRDFVTEKINKQDRF